MYHEYQELADLIKEAVQQTNAQSFRDLERRLGIGHDVLAKIVRGKKGTYSTTVFRLRLAATAITMMTNQLNERE